MSTILDKKDREALYQIVFYVPQEHLEKVKSAMFQAGAGKIGHYDSCAWQTKGQGQYRPLKGSNPSIGTHGLVERLLEYKVEMVCSQKHLRKAIEAMIESHPYEEVAYRYYPVNRGL